MNWARKHKTQVFLRADGNASIGFGHLMRTLAFASNLKDVADLLLFVRDPDDLAKKTCISYDIEFQDISRLPLEDEADYIASRAGDKAIVFLDGYAFDEEYQTKIIQKGCFLVCMDDHQDRRYLANCIINVAELTDPSLVQKPIYSKLVFGFRYALIRPEFSRDDSPIKNLSQMFICFGGGKETLPYIRKSIQAIYLSQKRFNKVVIVTNQVLLEDINKIISDENSIDSIEVKHSLKAKEMAVVLMNSSLAICSSSTVALECRAMNLTTICGYFVENQINIYNNLVKQQEIFPAQNLNETSAKQLSELIVKAEESEDNLKESIFNLSHIRKNYQKLLMNWEGEMDFNLRKAENRDADTYLVWANHPDVRRNAISTDPIIPENHYRWFNSRINSPTTLMLIAEWQEKSVGQIRFDYSGESWEIDYSIDAEFRGMGFGELLIRKGMWYLLKQEKKEILVSGSVKIDNLASNQVFMKLHFREDENEFKSNIELRKFSLRLSPQFLYL